MVEDLDMMNISLCVHSDIFIMSKSVLCVRSTDVNISSRFSINFEAFASELLEDFDEMFFFTTYIVIRLPCPHFQPHTSVQSVAEVINMLNSQTNNYGGIIILV